MKNCINDKISISGHLTMYFVDEELYNKFIMGYDSKEDTLKHIANVRHLLMKCAAQLLGRAERHDQSKLGPNEKPLFDKYTPLLEDCEYGSEEYKQYLKELKPALDSHYLINSHHPEHYKNGVDDMDLFDLIEMLMDWKAASERHSTGDIGKSLDINQERFNISPQLQSILENTARSMKWID